MPNHSPVLRLVVFFCQYDRSKYQGSFERLVRIVDGWTGIDWKIVVLDNARPGDWVHVVSGRIVQVGGDNTGWEFSAFDKGIDYVRRDADPPDFDLYLFVTDAFLAYGEEYLQRIDEFALRASAESGACLGWMDSFGETCQILDHEYDTWIRTSFLFVPASQLETIRPLCIPLDIDDIFGPGPELPFLPDAPVSQNLQRFLLGWLVGVETELTDTWHSRFELSDETFPVFRAKTLAILREHLLSARLKSAGVPCFDFRYISQVGATGYSPNSLHSIEFESWQWLGWMARNSGDTIENGGVAVLYAVDECRFPEAMDQGHDAELTLTAWVAANPQPRKIRVDIGNNLHAELPIDQARPEIGLIHSSIVTENCGVLGTIPLNGLEVGTHAINLTVPGTGVCHNLGTIRVLPPSQFGFQIRDIALIAHKTDHIWLILEGVVESSHPIGEVHFQVGENPCEVEMVLTALEPAPGELWRYTLSSKGEIEFDSKERKCRLDLAFVDSESLSHHWHATAEVQGSVETPVSLSRRHVGAWLPTSGVTEVHLSGNVVGAHEGDEVALKRDGHEIDRAPVTCSPSDTVSGTRPGSPASFEIHDLVTGLPPGNWAMSIDLLPESWNEVLTLATWSQAVSKAEPMVHVDEVAFLSQRGSTSMPLLRCAGWVEHPEMVPCLQVTIDDSVAGLLPILHVRADAPEHASQPLVRVRGFESTFCVDLKPGEHTVRLVDPGVNGGAVLWEENLHLAEPRRADLRIFSEDLDKFFRKPLHISWSPLRFAGSVETKHSIVSVTLLIDDVEISRVRARNGGPFELHWAPIRSGIFKVRVIVEADGLVLFQSPISRVDYSAAASPPHVSDVILRVLEKFSLQGKVGYRIDELSARLVALHYDHLAEFYDRLDKIDQSLQKSDSTVPRTVQPIPEVHHDTRRLKVLLASWEVPGPRHGGGVAIQNLIKGLRGRHDITLVHSYGIDESTWVDDVAGLVDRVVSVPRRHQISVYRGSGDLPLYLYDNYTPELRAAIQAELLRDTYDIVDYEYSTMYPHMVTTDVPEVLVVIEEGVRARANSFFTEDSGIEQTVDQLDDFLAACHFFANVLPSRIRHLIALTEEDAAAMLAYQLDSEVFVNPIGVDLDRYSAAGTPESQLVTSPKFVFLGNYRHPPNVKAVLDFASNIMPIVRETHPDARFLVIGDFAPHALQALHGIHGTEILGFVEDFRPIVSVATAFVAPIHHGTGMRVKILEAMACGAPIVATPLAVRGLGATPGRDYLAAESTTEFSDACLRLAGDQDLRRTLSKKGRELIREEHSCEARALGREAIWRYVIKEHRKGRA